MCSKSSVWSSGQSPQPLREICRSVVLTRSGDPERRLEGRNQLPDGLWAYFCDGGWSQKPIEVDVHGECP